ncbi:MAG: DUF3000 family protein, partial [Actinobacteria bacterium]|nr:DUF3000 family protein [Actinomycetota bacterium]
GTVTRVSSSSFGKLAPRSEGSEMEIRASWTPVDPAQLLSHLAAWASLLQISSGLTPLPDGVAPLHQRR